MKKKSNIRFKKDHLSTASALYEEFEELGLKIECKHSLSSYKMGSGKQKIEIITSGRKNLIR